MKPLRPRSAGLNLVELRFTIAILAVVLVIAALAVYGPIWSALKMIGGVPLAIFAGAIVVSAGVGAGFAVREIARGLLRGGRSPTRQRQHTPHAQCRPHVPNGT